MDRLPMTEKDHQNRQSDSRLCRRHGQDEEDEDLTVDIA
jgi:hypothetical protein